MKEILQEVMYGNAETLQTDTIKESMYSADSNLGQMYNDIKPQQEKTSNAIVRNRGTNMTTARTRRHITINIGEDRVTLPSPQFVYDLELKVNKMERDIASVTNHLRSVMNENNNLRREIDNMGRELKNKIDYPS